MTKTPAFTPGFKLNNFTTHSLLLLKPSEKHDKLALVIVFLWHDFGRPENAEICLPPKDLVSRELHSSKIREPFSNNFEPAPSFPCCLSFWMPHSQIHIYRQLYILHISQKEMSCPGHRALGTVVDLVWDRTNLCEQIKSGAKALPSWVKNHLSTRNPHLYFFHLTNVQLATL